MKCGLFADLSQFEIDIAVPEAVVFLVTAWSKEYGGSVPIFCFF
jgi:hypothetical protein